MGLYLFIIIAKIIGIIPEWLMYKLSDVLYLILRLSKYRKKTIQENIKNSFPHYTLKEQNQLRYAYLSFMADYVIESIKNVTISTEKVKEKVSVGNIALLDKYIQSGQSIIATAGHYGNWELCGLGASLATQSPLVGIYRPLANQKFEDYIGKVRQKFGLELIPVTQTDFAFEKYHGKRAVCYVMVGDQSPSNANKAYWTKFLNQETAYHYGIEKYSRKYNYPVLFCNVSQPKRGYYHIEMELLIDNPQNYAPNEITEICKNHLEKIIINNPAPWLWSHRRWKLKKPQLT